MSTYTGNWELFQKYATLALQVFPKDCVGIGLETQNPNTQKPFTPAELLERFNLIEYLGAEEIDIWDMPIPDDFWPFVHRFAQS